VVAFPGSRNLELCRIGVQCLNQKKKWMCFSWIGTKLKVELLQSGIHFHVFFTFKLLKYFRKAFSARGQLKKKYFF